MVCCWCRVAYETVTGPNNTLPLLAPLCAGLLFMGLVAAWATVRRGEPMARYLFLGWALYFGMATPFLLYISGFGPRSFFANWGVVIGTVCEALIFSFALGDRLQLIRQARSAKEKQLASLRQNMTGLMNGGLMQKLADNPVAVHQDPVISTMTVMFIDLPDDSLSASRFGPTGHFLRLRECMDDIARTVLHYDGVIDKSPAEGILCFFGYQFTDGEVRGHGAGESWLINGLARAPRPGIGEQDPALGLPTMSRPGSITRRSPLSFTTGTTAAA